VGPIAQGKGRTLENYCKPEHCKLYYTKDGTCPVELEAAIEVANDLRERKRLGGSKWLPSLKQLPYWQFEVYKISERIRMIVRTEEDEKAAKEDARAGDANIPQAHFDAVRRAREGLGMNRG